MWCSTHYVTCTVSASYLYMILRLTIQTSHPVVQQEIKNAAEPETHSEPVTKLQQSSRRPTISMVP